MTLVKTTIRKLTQHELLVLCDSACMYLWSDFMCFDTKYVIYCLHFFNEDSDWTLFCG